MEKVTAWALFVLLTNAFMEPPAVAQKILSDTTHTSSQPLKEQAMIAVLFEVFPREGHKQQYLDIAKSLIPQLNKMDGFISIERFESLYTPGKILSLSYWRDEESVKQWRNTEEHRLAQGKGRQEVFGDYRLRVVSIIRDYGMFDREQAPDDSKAHHDKSKN